MLFSRLARDFELAVITLFGGLAALAITPFAIYRFATGNIVVGLLDACVAICITGAVVYAWRTGKTQRVARFLVLVNVTGVVLSTRLLGYPGLFSAYPALLANYMLVGHMRAVAATVVTLALLVVQGRGFETPQQTIFFVVSAAIVSLFAFIFAYRTEMQRRQLESKAALDPLTGAQNRRVLDDELRIAIERFRREGTPAAVLMLDLDHFKSINDSYGHAVGDQVLVDFCAIVRRSTRRVDRFFRYGGEEFVLLLSPASATSLRTISQKLVAKVASELKCGQAAVTVSIGGAALREGEDVHAWMSRADACLYRAKRLGRNRAEVDDDPGEPSSARQPPREVTPGLGQEV